jgi:hypothetical protein
MPITFATPATTPTNSGTNLNSNASGPLSRLYSSGYPTNVLQFPSDLGSAQKGHMVIFTACLTSGSGYDESNTYTPAGPGGEVDQQVNLAWQPQKKRSGDVIALYMPDTLNFSYNASYSNLSLVEAGKEVVSGLAGMIGPKSSALAKGITSAVDSGASKVLQNALGKALNPQNALMFDGIDFRSFQMAFQFTPKTPEDSSNIQKIIQTFRGHAAPLIDTGDAGMTFTVPDSFIIQFVQVGGKSIDNPFITKVKESVLEHIDVNYSPNGIWSTHPDGSPTQINLTLGFKEIQLVDRAAIKEGY